MQEQQTVQRGLYVELRHRECFVHLNGVAYEARFFTTSTRHVYDLPELGLVVKVEREERAPQNQEEAERWARVQPEHRRYFAAVLAHADDFSWLVQQRVERPRRVKRATAEEMEALDMVTDLYDVTDVFPADEGQNWFLTEDGPVIIDYGV